jgi:hypothetical protein
MKDLFPFVGFLGLLLSTLGAGWLQGSLSDRWGPRPSAEIAADSLRRFPPSDVGNWRVRREVPLAPDAAQMLQSPAHIVRVYEHQQTGDSITVMVLLGPPGPIAVHTPEICYSSRDYTVDGERRVYSVKGASGGEHTLWDLALKANNLEGQSLRVLYGWSSGTHWEAARYARFAYGGLPHLYKLQLAIPTSSISKSGDFDPAQDFLANFIPQLQRSLVDASR